MYYETIEYKCLMEWRHHERWLVQQELKRLREESGLPVPRTIEEFKPGQIFEEWGNALYIVGKRVTEWHVSVTVLARSKLNDDYLPRAHFVEAFMPENLIPVRRENLPLYLGGGWRPTSAMERVLKGVL